MKEQETPPASEQASGSAALSDGGVPAPLALNSAMPGGLVQRKLQGRLNRRRAAREGGAGGQGGLGGGRVLQRSPDPRASGAKTTDTGQASDKHRPGGIDSPAPGISKAGFIDSDDGSNIRTGPAELGGTALTSAPLPPATRVFVSGQHPKAPDWWYVSAFLPGNILRGYVQNFRVNTDLPEPSAKLYQIKGGDTVEKLAVNEFSAAVRDGHDLRYYENVLLAVNRDKNRQGIKGSFQDPSILGGGSNNILLEAGRRIWLVSPGYASALEGKVPDGSLTNGLHAKAKRVLGHLEDILKSVTDSPQFFGDVAGEYADAILQHLPEIIGITAGFILAESASAFLAASPTGVGQLAAVLIQLTLAAFGAKAGIDAGVQALEHGRNWLTIAWTAKGDDRRIHAASKEFLRMLVSIAMAALAFTGMKGNVGKGLKIADAIQIQPPTLGWSPAVVTPDGAAMGGGPVFQPGSIATTGPVDISPSMMTGGGYGGSRLKPSYEPAGKSDAELQQDLDQTQRPGESAEQAKARAEAARSEIEWRKAEAAYKGLGDKPPRINIRQNDANYSGEAHTLERHGPDVPLRRTDAPPGQRTIEGRLFGDPPWGNAEKYSYRWLDESTMNRTVNEYLQANWEKVRSDLALDPAKVHSATFDAGNAIGEGFWRDGTKSIYGKTSLVTLRIKFIPGRPPVIELLTSFPNGRGS